MFGKRTCQHQDPPLFCLDLPCRQNRLQPLRSLYQPGWKQSMKSRAWNTGHGSSRNDVKIREFTSYYLAGKVNPHLPVVHGQVSHWKDVDLDNNQVSKQTHLFQIQLNCSPLKSTIDDIFSNSPDCPCLQSRHSHSLSDVHPRPSSAALGWSRSEIVRYHVFSFFSSRSTTLCLDIPNPFAIIVVIMISKNSVIFVTIIPILMMTNLEPGSLKHLLHLALVHVVRQVRDVSSERWSSWDPAGKLFEQNNKSTCLGVVNRA